MLIKLSFLFPQTATSVGRVDIFGHAAVPESANFFFWLLKLYGPSTYEIVKAATTEPIYALLLAAILSISTALINGFIQT